MKRSVHTSVTVALSILVLTACASVPPGQEGEAFYNAGNYLAAADAFTEEIDDHPRSAAAWNNRAVARVRLGDLDGAIRDYNRAVELAPSDAEIYFNRGNALLTAGQYQNAIIDYDRAIQITPVYSRALYNRGTAYLLAGQPEPARRDWQSAVALEADPYTKSAMRRSLGLEPAAPAVAAASPPAGQPTTAWTIAPPPPLGAAPGAAPLQVAPRAGAVAGATPSPEPAASPAALDARALAIRGISRKLDGDHAGAMHDLNAALALESDAKRREEIARLIHLLDPPR